MNISHIVFFILLFLPYKLESNKENIIKKIEDVKPIVVTATTYKANEGETDSTPNITASGFKIDMKNPKRHKLIAVSRDLKKKMKYGSKVYVKGTGKHDGVYVVRDLMNKRYKKRIDILIGHNDNQRSYSKVKIYKID